MASQGGSAKAKKQASPVLVVIAALVLVAFVGWLAKATLFPAPTVAPMDDKAKERNSYIRELAKKSGGDFSKLTPEEQQKLQKMTGGYGAAAMSAVLNEGK